MLLAADIGGTNARFGLFDGARAQLAVEVFRTADWPGAAAAASEFLRRHPAEPVSACFAVAGPVQDGHSAPVNLLTDTQLLAAGCDAVLLIARAFTTRQSALKHAVHDLAPFNVIGTVLNGGKKARVGRRNRNYYYYQGPPK